MNLLIMWVILRIVPDSSSHVLTSIKINVKKKPLHSAMKSFHLNYKNYAIYVVCKLK